jgi:phage protein D
MCPSLAAGQAPRVADFQITNVSGDLQQMVKKVTVDYVQDGPDMFAVTFTNQTTSQPGQIPVFTHQGGLYPGHFKEGDSIDISIGYQASGSMVKMISGEITGMEASYREHDPSTYTVRGFDKLHRLSRGRKQRTFMDMKDSQIAEQIAGELGLGADVEDSGKVHDHVFQNNLSDIDFLYARARFIDFELSVDGDKLTFKRPQVSGSGVMTITYGENLKRSHFKLSTSQQVDEVQVRGWSPKEKKEIVGKASPSDILSMMGGDTSGPQSASGKFGGGQKVSVICNVPLEDQEHADAIAKARMNEIAMQFITGNAEVEGDPSIRAGKLVEFARLGKKFDGQYYVIHAEHTLKPGSGPGAGYITRFSFKRAAAGNL